MLAESPSSILIVKTSAIGDVIQTFPVLEYLRSRFPQAKIDWVVEEGIAPLLRAHPQVNDIIEIHTKRWKEALFSNKTSIEFKNFRKNLRTITYDLLFDLQGNTKSALITSSAKARVKIGFGWKSAREKSNCLVTTKRFNVLPELNTRLKYLRIVQEYFNDTSEFTSQGIQLFLNANEEIRLQHICQDPLLSCRPRLMICFGSKWPNKRLEYSTLRSWLEKVVEDCHPTFVFIFAGEEEKRVADELASYFKERSLILGNLSLPLWQRLMWEMDGIFAVDSAALHLCGTTHTPSLSVFGPSLATSYKPMEERHVAFQGTCPYQQVFTSRCPLLRTCSTGACMRQIQVEELFQVFKYWLKNHLNLS